MMKILIIKPSSLGDIVHALQVVHTLKERIPGMRVSWVAREIFAPLLEGSPLVDKVFVFERQGGAEGFLRLVRQIREHRFDRVIDLQGLARTGLLTLLARGGEKWGRADSREGAGFFYHRTPPLPPEGKYAHAVDILLQFCRLFDLPPVPASQALPFRQDLPSFPGEDSLKGLPPPAVLFPGSRRPEKEWNGFAELTDLLLERNPEMPVIWAGNEPLPTLETPPRFFNLTGKTGLLPLVRLLRIAGSVVANDSGPMHLAAALHRPTLGIFGPTDPARFGPYPPNQPGLNFVTAPGGKLSRLSPEEVYRHWQACLPPAPCG